MYPVSVSAPSARPPPWSAPIVGSSIMSTCGHSPTLFAERIRRDVCFRDVRRRENAPRYSPRSHRLLRVELVAQPRARRHVGDEHARRADHLYVALAHALVTQPAGGRLDPLDAHLRGTCDGVHFGLARMASSFRDENFTLSFICISSIEPDVDAPRRPHSHEHVTFSEWTHEKGMPMLYSVDATYREARALITAPRCRVLSGAWLTSRLTRRARQQKTTIWSGKSSGSAGASDVLPVSGGDRRRTS